MALYEDTRIKKLLKYLRQPQVCVYKDTAHVFDITKHALSEYLNATVADTWELFLLFCMLAIGVSTQVFFSIERVKRAGHLW